MSLFWVSVRVSYWRSYSRLVRKWCFPLCLMKIIQVIQTVMFKRCKRMVRIFCRNFKDFLRPNFLIKQEVILTTSELFKMDSSKYFFIGYFHRGLEFPVIFYKKIIWNISFLKYKQSELCSKNYQTHLSYFPELIFYWLNSDPARVAVLSCHCLNRYICFKC